MAKIEQFTFTSDVWLYNGTWHFATMPPEPAEEVRMLTFNNRKGFGSVRVEVTIGKTIWRTSLFPDSKAGTYLLPLKAEVRKKEEFGVGDRVKVTVKLVRD